jgi:hypothetical protein
MTTEIKIIIVTGPLDDDDLVAEVYVGGVEFAEVLHLGNEIKIFPRNDNSPWNLNPGEVIDVINRAINKLSGS